MMKKWLREPFLIFLILGLFFYVISYQVAQTKSEDNKQIVISPLQVEQLYTQFEQTWNRAPRPEEIGGLVNAYVREEIYYREALALGLNQNDDQIRKRMSMKLDLLLNDMTTPTMPSDQVLSTYVNENPELFRTNTIVSFEQVYLNPDKHKNIAQDAAQALEQLRQGADSETLGDVTMLGYFFNKNSQSDIARQFGEAFASEISELPVGDWSGPYRSGMGLHLVKIHERIDGRIPDLSEIRPTVEREWMVMRSRQLKDAAYKKLRENYEVVIEKVEDVNE